MSQKVPWARMRAIKIHRKSFDNIGHVLVLFAALNLICYVVAQIGSDDSVRVQYIPDDGFYYLTLARNFATQGIWSFDSGISFTSGFHLLFAYLLAAVQFFLRLDTERFIKVGLLISSLFSLAAIVNWWHWGYRAQNQFFLAFFALVIGGRNFVQNTISLTEWSLTLFLATIYFRLFLRDISHIRKRSYLGICIIGILGSLARADFGLLPLSIMIASAISFLLFRERSIRLALVGFLGAVTGLLIMFVHNYYFTGEMLQSSARMKLYWSTLVPPNFFSVPLFIGRILPTPGLVLLAILIATALATKAYMNRKTDPEATKQERSTHHGVPKEFAPSERNSATIAIAIAICLGGYVFVYARNGAVQPWYSVNLMVPILAAIYLIAQYLNANLGAKTRATASVIILGLLGINVLRLYPITQVNAPWPHQEAMYYAGRYLHANRQPCQVGAWNAGIIGYYEGGHVINLDGLVNNNVYDYVIDNRLPIYISDTEICRIVDFEQMVESEIHRIRGGYNDDVFVSSLLPIQKFEYAQTYWRTLTLYHLPAQDLK